MHLLWVVCRDSNESLTDVGYGCTGLAVRRWPDGGVEDLGSPLSLAIVLASLLKATLRRGMGREVREGMPQQQVLVYVCLESGDEWRALLVLVHACHGSSDATCDST